MSFLYFLQNALRLVFYFVGERKKEATHAAEIIVELEKQFDGAFDEDTRKKIIRSHSVYNPLIIDAFCKLHNRVSSKLERRRLIYYFTCSSLLDNFFDRAELNSEQIQQIIYNPNIYQSSTFDEKAFIYCHTYLLNSIEDRSGYLSVLDSEIRAQHKSMQQFDKSISTEMIESIMKEKGGNAVLMCRYYLDLPVSKVEDKCWYQLGVLVQLNNDLYDIYKDINDGVETLATRCTDAFVMEKYVLKQSSLMKQIVLDLPCPNKNKKRFSVAVAGVCALARVAVDQLKRLQGNAERLPDFHLLERKQLIVDMEKPSTILRCLRYMYRNGKSA